MISKEFSPHERLEALKEWSVLTREAEAAQSFKVRPLFEAMHAMYGDKRLPPRLEVISRYGKILLPRMNSDKLLHDAYLMPDDNITGKDLGARLSYVLEIPHDNVIFIGNDRIERTVDSYAARFYPSGLVELLRGTRMIERDTEERTQQPQDIVSSFRSFELDRASMAQAVSVLLPYRKEKRSRTW